MDKGINSHTSLDVNFDEKSPQKTTSSLNAQLFANSYYDDVYSAIDDDNPYLDYWTGKKRAKRHIKDHHKEFGLGMFDIEKYTTKALNFLNSETRTMKIFVALNGSIYMYDTKTNEFGIKTKDGLIVTYFKPTNKEAYFYKQFEELGDYFIKY